MLQIPHPILEGEKCRMAGRVLFSRAFLPLSSHEPIRCFENDAVSRSPSKQILPASSWKIFSLRCVLAIFRHSSIIFFFKIGVFFLIYNLVDK